MFYTHVNLPDEQSLTVHHGGEVQVIRGDYHQFDEILERVKADDESVFELLDKAKLAANRFEPLTDRIAVHNGQITYDGDIIDNSLSKTLLRFIDDEVPAEQWSALLLFFEKVMTNPQSHSRDQLYDWVDKQNLTITDEGNIVAYKGVTDDGEGGYRSGYAGTAIVDGQKIEGYIPNYAGAVVTMPRSEVHHDPNSACSTGLHVGTYSYAQTFNHGATLTVVIDPRDFVSVPHDGSGEKARVCRYLVAEVTEKPLSEAIVSDDEAYQADGLGDGSASAQEAAGEPVDTSKMVTPGWPRFQVMVQKAKAQKKGLVKLATKEGWVQVGDDPKDRKSWKAPKKR